MVRRKRGFTLIELLVVIAIIGILATVVAVNYSGAQKRSRDSKRKSDVNAIVGAYQMHYQDKKSWQFSNSELAAAIPGTTAEALSEGWIDCRTVTNPSGGCYGTGSGWFNYENLTGNENGKYLISVAHALASSGYLPNMPIDPLINNILSATIKNPDDSLKAAQYQKYVCRMSAVEYGIIVAARLEETTATIVSSELAPQCNGSTEAVIGNGMNYVVGTL